MFDPTPKGTHATKASGTDTCTGTTSRIGSAWATTQASMRYQVILICLTFDVREVLQLVTEQPLWFWRTENGDPTLKSFDEIHASHAQKAYLEGRDLRRGMRGLERKWATRTMSFGAEAAELHLRTRGDQARMLRIAWDYTMHGGNQALFGIPGDHSCQQCGSEDSAEHWMGQCTAE